MTIKVLGPGCTNCKTLEQRAQQALEQLNIEAQVEKIIDYPGIMSYGIMSTPGLVIDEEVVSQGRVPTVDTIKELIYQAQQ